ncbi:MAG: ABC transporter ATP-binding protein [Candidatus Caldarchaeum sp.]
MSTIIETEDVWFKYPNGVTALRGVTLNLKQGEYIALVGMNGSGKTTLAKNLNGLLRPTRGAVWVKGVDTRRVRSEQIAKTVGYVFQNPDHMLFATTIEKEVEFGPRNLHLPEDDIRRRVETALEITGLSKLRSESPLFFGKGIRRMITLAAVLSMEPEVMVIDEPTTGMDCRTRKMVMGLIDKLNKGGMTVIIITHDMRIVADHARRCIVMLDGRVLADDNTERIFEMDEVLRSAGLRPPQRIEIARYMKAYTQLGLGQG